MTKIKIGIVGMGFIADWHYKSFKINPDAEIVGMTQDFYADENKINKMRAQLKEKCTEWNIKAYDNFDEMVNDPGIDALIIGSVNPYHYDQIKKGFANNKFLLVEKPVVVDLDQIKELKELVLKNNYKLFPGHNFVYRNAVIKAKELIDEGKLGQIMHGSILVTHTISEYHQYGWRGKKELSAGGTLMDSGHHVVYQSIYLLGVPSKLQAYTSKLRLKNMDCEDIAQVNLLYPDGSMGFLMQSWTSSFGNDINGIRIFGDKGELIITDALYLNGEKIDSDTGYESTFINQAMAFTDYILHDKQPVSTLDDAENSLKMILGAYESAEKGIVINL
ncbi:MAG: Gfo/Idh/MocA family oxidoreductase [Ignavibacteriaceae bacterium]